MPRNVAAFPRHLRLLLGVVAARDLRGATFVTFVSPKSPAGIQSVRQWLRRGVGTSCVRDRSERDLSCESEECSLRLPTGRQLSLIGQSLCGQFEGMTIT